LNGNFYNECVPDSSTPVELVAQVYFLLAVLAVISLDVVEQVI